MKYHFSIVKMLKAVGVLDVIVVTTVISSVTSASEFDNVNASRKEIGSLRFVISIDMITRFSVIKTAYIL